MAMVSVMFGGEKVGEYPLDKQVIVVGRDPGCDIHIDNLGVSRTHCQFIKRGNGYIVQDMNSQNGTYVNGKRIGEHFLNDGDEILVGKHTLKYSAQGVVTAPVSAPDPKKDDLVADALRTYVMDGAKIRERLSGMQPPAGTGPVEPPSSAAPRKALDHAADFDPLKPRKPITATLPRPAAAGTGSLKAVLYLSLAINIVLMGLVATLIVVLLRFAGKVQTPQPAEPAPTTQAQQ